MQQLKKIEYIYYNSIGDNMVDYINEIGIKKGYSKSVCQALEKIVPACIMWLGEEYKDLILEVVENTTIYTCSERENIYDALKKVDNVENDGIVKEEELRMASGVCSNVPQFSYKDGKFNIDKVERYIMLKKSDFNSESDLRTFTHEFLHAVKAYKNAEYIKDDIFYSRSGFVESFYKLSVNESGDITKELIKESGVGAEEGANGLDEAEVMSIITGNEKTLEGYKILSVIAEEKDNLLGLKEERIKASLLGDISSYKEKFNGNGEDIFTPLSHEEDELAKHIYSLYKNMADESQREQIAAEMKESFNACRGYIDKALLERGIQI